MGLGNFFKRQLATVIEWTDQQPGILLYKFPSDNDELKNASKLIISPGQGAVVVYEGQVRDVITDGGVYNMETDNHPFITTLKKLRTNFESEHKLRIYFFRSAENVNQNWGTATPVKYLDPVYKFPVELGANGNFSFRLSDAKLFFTEIAGSRDTYSVPEARALLQNRIPQVMATYLATTQISYQQIDAQLTAIAAALTEQLNAAFANTGFILTDFRINGTVFDNDTQQRINKISDVTADSMAAAAGGLDYVQLQKLKALRDAARNEGGLAGAGLQMGAGMELGKAFADKKDSIINADAGADPVAQLQKLKLLLNEGILTQEEFDAKKKEWLDKL